MLSQISSLSLRAKVTLGIVLPLVLILAVFTVIENRRHREVLLANLSVLASYSGEVIQETLRHQMAQSDFDGVQQFIDAVGAREEFWSISLFDPSGQVTFAPGGRGVGTHLDSDHPECQPCHSLAPEARPAGVILTTESGQRVFRTVQPIENGPDCIACHEHDGPAIAFLLTDLSLAPLEAALIADLRENALWWLGTLVTVIVIVNTIMSRFVIRRVENLTRAITSLGRGQELPPLPTNGSDEIGQLAGAFYQMSRQVRERDEENRDLSRRLRRQSSRRGELLKRLITAQEDERKRVARELHDDLGQVLSGLSLRLEVMRKSIASNSDHSLNELGQMQSLIAYASERMYDLILALRPSALDDLGLARTLRAHVERQFNGTGIAYEMDCSGLSTRLPSEMEVALYRVCQEALSNVVRHARARHVRVTLASPNGAFAGEIVDDGQGFDPESVQTDGDNPRGLGLLGMQERIAQCDGQLEIVSERGKGTRIRIWIPLEEEPVGKTNSHTDC